MRLRAWPIAIVFALMILPGCTFYGEHPAKSFKEATGGEGLERSFWRDIQKQDWKDLEQHLASNFVYVTPGGRWEREAALEQFRQLELKEYSIGDMTTEMNRDTFVVTYTITLRGTFKGQALPAQPLRCMTVWQQQKRSWVVIAQSSPIS
jgi:hypothetical protein